MEVQNTRTLAELEQALTDTHTKPTGDPHVHDWPQTAAVKLVKERPRGQPSELLEFSVSVKGLGGAQGASQPCNPIAVLLSSEEPWTVLGYTEWQQDRGAEEHVHFAGVLVVDAAVLPGGPAATLFLQLRQVDNPLWDAHEAFDQAAVQQMRLLGRSSFKMRDALKAPRSTAGGPGSLQLHLDTLGGLATLQVRSAAGWAANRIGARGQPNPHATCNFAFGTAGRQEQRDLRVCEHMLPCAYGKRVPCEVLSMLLADAQLNGSAWSNSQQHAPPSLPHSSLRPAELWALQDASGWSRLEALLEALLEGAQASRPSGFKESTRKKQQPLGALPTNLCLNILEVQERGECSTLAVYPTITVGASAAHCLGFQGEGCSGLGAKLQRMAARLRLGYEQRDAVAELAHAYAARSAVVIAQAYATLAASFALCCQAHAARRNRRFFVQVQQCGFLLQAESLLSTRGDDWGMLQDLTEAWTYLGGVHLVLMPGAVEEAEVTDGVSLRGGRHHPTLCFTPAELGFANAGAAAALGLEIGAEIAVVPVLATQGINEEQSVANFLRTHTAEQARLNVAALATLTEYQHKCAALPSAAGGAAAAPGLGPRRSAGSSTNGSSARPEAESEAKRRNLVSHRQRQMLDEARGLLESPPEAKNVVFLQRVALLTRAMSGGRVTMCKSGKDRTSMSVTLEHGRLLQEQHGMALAQLARAVHTMRRRGVRRENVRLNTPS